MTRPPPTGVSVVVICRNEADYIEGCLSALLRAIHHGAGGAEVVVVDGGSTDGTPGRVRDWAAAHEADRFLRVVSVDPAGYGRQRNAGVRAARYPWVAFVSADVRVPPTWLAEVRASVHPGIDLAIGRFTLDAPAGRPQWMASLAKTVYPGRNPEPWVERCSTVHLVVARSRLLAQPFDETLAGCEDKEIAHRLRTSPAWRAGAVLPVRVEHVARESVGQLLRKLYRESRELTVVARRYGPAFIDCFGWRAASRRAVVRAVLIMAAGLGAAALDPWYGVAAAAAVPLAAWYPSGWRRRGRFATVPLAALHLTAMWCVAAGWLRAHARRLDTVGPQPTLAHVAATADGTATARERVDV